MQLQDYKPSFTELSQEERLALLRRIRASRLVSKKSRKKAKTQPGKWHIEAQRDGEDKVSECGKKLSVFASRSLRLRMKPYDEIPPRDIERGKVCKNCLKRREARGTDS